MASKFDIPCRHIKALNLTAVETWLLKNKKYGLLKELRKIRARDAKLGSNVFQLRLLLSYSINTEIKTVYPNATVIYLGRDGFWPYVFSQEFSFDAYYFQTSRRAIKEISATNKKGLSDYLHQLNLPKSTDVILFDVGWTGNHPTEVGALLSNYGYASLFRILLLGAHCKVADEVSTMLFDNTSETKLSGFSNLFELILSAPHLSLVSYNKNEQLQKNQELAINIRSMMALQVSKHLVSSETLLSIDEISKLFESLFSWPHPDFLREISELQHFDDLSGRVNLILGKNIFDIIIRHRRQKIWTEGTIVKLFPRFGRWFYREPKHLWGAK